MDNERLICIGVELEESFTPDELNVVVSLGGEHESREECLAEYNRTMRRLIEALVEAGIPASEIKDGDFELSPHVEDLYRKDTKKDEFYTQLSDIEKEMRYYKRHFKGKTVLCNCDDPFESKFFDFFGSNDGAEIFIGVCPFYIVSQHYTGIKQASVAVSSCDYCIFTAYLSERSQHSLNGKSTASAGKKRCACTEKGSGVVFAFSDNSLSFKQAVSTVDFGNVKGVVQPLSAGHMTAKHILFAVIYKKVVYRCIHCSAFPICLWFLTYLHNTTTG